MFEEDNKFGRIAEDKVAILLRSRGHLVEDVSGDFVAGDLKVTMKNTGQERIVEVKHQNCISKNEIIIECYTPKYKYGWFFKDLRVTDYCFYLNDRYIFLSKEGLHHYVAEFGDVFGDNRKCKYKLWNDSNGFYLLTLDLPHLLQWLEDNNYYNQNITYDFNKF